MANRPGPDGEASNPNAVDKPSAPSFTAPPPVQDDRTQAIDAQREVARVVALQPTQPMRPVLPNPPQFLADRNSGNTGANVRDPLQSGPFDYFQPMTGEARLRDKILNPPSYAGSPHSDSWDRWVVSLPLDKNDDEYSTRLTAEQTAAADRLRKNHGENYNPSLKLNPKTQAEFKGYTDTGRDEASALTKQNNASNYLNDNKTDAKGNVTGLAPGKTPVVYNVYGEQVDPRKVMNLTGGTTPPVQGNTYGSYVSALTGTTDPNADPNAAPPTAAGPAPVDVQTLMRSGKVVFAGYETHKGSYGAEYTQARFMSVNDANLAADTWTPEQVAGFQQLVKNKVTGVMDDATRKDWEAIVKTANRRTTAGTPTNPYDMIAAVGAAAKASGGSGGSGGGGGGRGGGRGGSGGGGAGGTLVPAGQARQFLTQYMKQYVGREANDAEAAAFAKAINGAAADPNFDAQNFATQWIQSHNGGEGGAYQSATSYYHAAMQALQNGM